MPERSTSPSWDELQPGQLVGGRYQVTGLLGRGGMGAVYRALHIELQKEVALKTLTAGELQSEDSARRFLREARSASQLEHPNTVTVTDFGLDHQLLMPYLVMELLRGQSLAELLQAQTTQPLPHARLVRLLAQVCSSLEEAHSKGLIHRDLKPSNIYVTRQAGMADFVKVLDFGLAKSYLEGPESGGEITRSGEVLGTPYYMSPEQVRAQPLGPAADIYSLGVVLYEALALRKPFTGPSLSAVLVAHCEQMAADPRRIRPDLQLPDDLVEIVQIAMAKKPEQRYSAVGAMRAALLATAAARQSYTLPDASAPLSPLDLPNQPTPRDRSPAPAARLGQQVRTVAAPRTMLLALLSTMLLALLLGLGVGLAPAADLELPQPEDRARCC